MFDKHRIGYPHVYRSDYAAALAARTLLLRELRQCEEDELRSGVVIEAVVQIAIPGCDDRVRIFRIGGSPRENISRHALTAEVNLAVGFEEDFLE